MAKKTNPSNMDKPKQRKTRTTPRQRKTRTTPRQQKMRTTPKQQKAHTTPKTKKKPTSTSWFKFVNDDKHRLAIPVGPRFQADLPEWVGPLNNKVDDNAKWLGTKIWPIHDRRLKTKEDAIGQGRPDFCLCPSRGSVECVKRHVHDKRVKLVSDLGPAFWRWKFDEMGDEVSKLWNLDEENEFESIVKRNPNFREKSFMKPALERLGSQSKKTIVSYYFNAYIPRQMSAFTRSGHTVVDTDDEADDRETPNLRVSRKKCQPHKITSSGCKCLETKYLKGRR